MKKDFGLTWWGQNWLDSLTNIDYANRIPRGARYARNGSVREIKFYKDGSIKARVKGTRPAPYKIIISVPQFSDKGKILFINELAKHPSLLSRLLNRELPEEVLPIAHQCGLQVFPKTWMDLGMYCSCPDWAVPCKHIAAVIYTICREIDNDPFLVFNMHGLDIVKEVESSGKKLVDAVDLSIEKSSDLLQLDKGTSANNKKWSPDFSTIPTLSDQIIDILDENSQFEAGFREKYRNVLNKLRKTLTKAEPIIESDNRFDFSSDLTIQFDDNLLITGKISGEQKTISGEHLIECFHTWESLERILMQPSSEVIFNIYRLAKSLILKGCIVPKIIETNKKLYKIIWGPALIDPTVNHLAEEATIAADKLAVFGKNQPLQESGLRILEAFITLLIKKYAEKSNNVLANLFFCGLEYPFNGIGELGIPGSIKAWLSPLRIADSGLQPFLKVEDIQSGFLLDLGFVVKGKEVALKSILSKKTYEDDRFRMIGQLNLILKHLKGVSSYIDTGAAEPIRMNDSDFYDFLRNIIPIVRLLSMRVILPKGLDNLIHPKPSLSISRKSSTGKAYLRAEDLLEFNWTVAVGNEFISHDQLLSLTKKARGLIRFKSSYICVDDEDLERISKAFLSSKGPGKMRTLQAALIGEYEGVPVLLNDEVRELIHTLTETHEIPAPTNICATLRPYQVRGYSWMFKNFQLGFGSIIADDMGLGKTLQVISFLQKLKNDGALVKKKAIIIVPTGLLPNWETEISRFAPSISYFRYHGPNRNIDNFSSDVLITSYGVVRSDAEILKKIKWEVQVIDEAQNIKNSNTAQTQAVKSIPAETRLAMSGTPVENRLSEFWSIMDFVNKGYLETAKQFREKFTVPIEDQGDEACAEKFRKITAPFMLRRLKTDKSIISDLPDKVTRNFSPTLTPLQATLYQQTVNEYMATLGNIDTEDKNSLFKREGLILQMILALKQICNHPSLFIKDGKADIELSGKCKMLVDLVSSIVDSGEKVLIFTQFKEMGDLLVEILNKEIGIKPLFYHGGCTLKQRTEMVERFQNIRSEQVFILSLKAAGTGLNLTAASNVIHFDLWWNPAVEAQATDRAFRIGQHKNVMVTRFVTAGTFEEKIDKIISHKKSLADLTVTSGESWIGKLSDKELKELFFREN